jgi:hypothetical protein
VRKLFKKLREHPFIAAFCFAFGVLYGVAASMLGASWVFSTLIAIAITSFAFRAIHNR